MLPSTLLSYSLCVRNGRLVDRIRIKSNRALEITSGLCATLIKTGTHYMRLNQFIHDLLFFTPRGLLAVSLLTVMLLWIRFDAFFCCCFRKFPIDTKSAYLPGIFLCGYERLLHLELESIYGLRAHVRDSRLVSVIVRICCMDEL